MSNLVVESLTKEYPTRAEPLAVLRGVSFGLASGENLAILGPSGCGKSTLLHIVGTLDRPTSGKVLLDGIDPFTLGEPELAEFRNARIGFVFQDHHLLPQCSVLENVLLPTLANGAATPAQLERAKHLLDRVGLAPRMDHLPAEISGGERQRAAIARALVLSPTVVLADEPTGNLDRTNAARIAELLLELQSQEQIMLVIVTHSLELAKRCQKQVELDEGQVRAATASATA